MTTEQLSDEEFARRLQAELLAEELGHEVPADDVAYMQQLSAAFRQSQEDEELAKKLQAELDGEAATEYHQPAPTQSLESALFQTPYIQEAATNTATTVTVESKLSNLSVSVETSTEEKDEGNEKPSESNEEEFQCLICYEVPDEYVILPMCKVPHLYCMECAEKMMSNQPQQNTYSSPYYRRGGTNNASNKTIQCPLCSAVTPLSDR